MGTAEAIVELLLLAVPALVLFFIHCLAARRATLMYAPHFAAALAIKGRSPGAPLWALLIGAFIPDLLWIALARIGIEPAQTSNFFDDWSHSLISVAVSGDRVCISFPPEGQACCFRNLAGCVLALPTRFSGSSEATRPSTK